MKHARIVAQKHAMLCGLDEPEAKKVAKFNDAEGIAFPVFAGAGQVRLTVIHVEAMIPV